MAELNRRLHPNQHNSQRGDHLWRLQQTQKQYTSGPEIAAAQSALTNLAKQTGNNSFNPGVVDGKLGPNTMKALRAYKGKAGLNDEEVQEAIENLTHSKGFGT